jgi:asparagine synthase (glutamine-hydrolysing)
VYSKRLYDAMKKHCTVVLSGNGADEIFTGYSGDETSAEFDRIRRRLLHVPASLLNLVSQQRRQRWDHYRLGGNTVGQWARADMMGYVSAFAPDAATRDECAHTIDQMIDQYEAAGIETMLDFNMHRALLASASDTNYRLPDVTGYAAQVEVRSPYLDHRMVEFAARLPHHFKVGRHGAEPRPKYLPRRFYERYVGPDIAWAPKKGMGANLRWDLELVHNQKFSEAMESAYRAVAADGLAAEPFRQAYRDYCDGVNSNAASLPTAGTMMNGFMLGSWLKLKKPTTPTPAASAKVAG